MGQVEKVRVIVDDVYGRGHGKAITIQRIKDVCGLDEEAATIAFTSALNDIRRDEARWLNRSM